jgi:hypothetical protein
LSNNGLIFPGNWHSRVVWYGTFAEKVQPLIKIVEKKVEDGNPTKGKSRKTGSKLTCLTIYDIL